MGKRRSGKKRTKRTTKWFGYFVMLLLLGGLGISIFYFFSDDKKKIMKHELLVSIPSGFSSFGIDISHHQGSINWEDLFIENDLDSVISFVYCKATEGIDHVDTEWKNNRKALLDLGKPHGAYHFFSIKSDALSQAKHFLFHWKKESMDLPPVLDVETEAENDKILIKSMKTWLIEVEKKSGSRPIIYTSLHFYETKFKNDFKDYFFWIAAYSRKPDYLNDKRILHWQYTDQGNLPGIDEKIDFNVSKTAFL